MRVLDEREPGVGLEERSVAVRVLVEDVGIAIAVDEALDGDRGNEDGAAARFRVQVRDGDLHRRQAVDQLDDVHVAPAGIGGVIERVRVAAGLALRQRLRVALAPDSVALVEGLAGVGPPARRIARGDATARGC